jgi:hypothetical protein
MYENRNDNTTLINAKRMKNLDSLVIFAFFSIGRYSIVLTIKTEEIKIVRTNISIETILL